MKNIFVIAAALCIAGSACVLPACNDAKYDTMGVHAFIHESVSNMGAKITITETGVNTEVTPCLSAAAGSDVNLKFMIDPEALKEYNRIQATSYVLLPDDVYEMDFDVTIEAGKFSAPPTKIYIKPLPPKYFGESYALPLRLVSVNGSVATTSKTTAFVIATEAVTVSSLPMFVGSSGLVADGFPLSLPEFTIEARFQISNTSNRNRAVFTNGGSVLLRFEDPQSNTTEHKKHSLVQFQGDGWYMNPTLSFEPNKWQHLALTYDGSAVTLYVNGAFAGTKSGSINPDFGKAYWFGGDAGGGHGTGSTDWWRGCKILCSELRIWSYCRSAAQIQNNMTTTSAKSQGLEAYWRMNEGAGNVFQDITGNGRTLKTALTPTWVHNIKSTDPNTEWPD